MKLSLRAAAQPATVSKSTILRAIKSGKLSASRTADPGHDIEPAEPNRVYPPQRSSTNTMGQDATSASNTGATVSTPSTPAATLEADLAGLREILRRADAAAEELQQDWNKWRNVAK